MVHEKIIWASQESGEQNSENEKVERMAEKVNKKESLLTTIGLPRLVLICLAGIVLMILSLPQDLFSGKQSTKEKEKDTQTVADQAMDLYVKKEENYLKELLEQVDGIGKVKVMISLESSEEKVMLKDEETTNEETKEKGGSEGTRENSNSHTNSESILVEEGDGKKPYVVRIQAPKVKGVVVVAQGVDGAEKNEEIIQAVQALFDVEAHRIVVMKME